MLLTRRAALTMTLSALAVPALIRPALAACKPLDLGKGIAFTRQDGSRGVAQRKGDVVVIDYVTNRGAWIDRRQVKSGVFETSRIVEESEDPIVGTSAPTFTWTYSPKVITPQDGATWSGRIKELVEVTISDEEGTVQRQRARWKGVYRCSEPREVSLSGCTHAALTVEATFSGDDGTRSQRWVYFPDLGLGLETRRNGTTNGLTALRPA